jgi:hypothetical protein
MSYGEHTCNGCGKWAPPTRRLSDGRTGRIVDLGEGDGPLWTCYDCLPFPEADDAMSTAPWTPEEVRNLEAWQASPRFHPYTCTYCRDADGYPLQDEHRLVPTTNGWRCPTCNMRQNWCYRPMLDGPPPLPPSPEPDRTPALEHITIRTRNPDKWRFHDTDTGQVWRWAGGRFVLDGRPSDEAASTEDNR